MKIICQENGFNLMNSAIFISFIKLLESTYIMFYGEFHILIIFVHDAMR